MTRLEDEIRAALLPGKATDEEVEAWVSEALVRTPRRRLHFMWPMLAAAAILAAVFWPRAEKAKPAPVALADEAAERLLSTDVAQQRKRNLAFLEKSRTLKDARKGYWAIVTGGDSLHVAKTVKDAIAWADKLYPEAKHRFLFQVGEGSFTRGDVIGDRGPVALATGGLFFFDQAGIKPDDDRLRKVNGKDVALELEVNGKPIRIRLDRESLGTLILPAGVHYPRAEIPGRLILEDLDRNWRSFRRYLVRVRHKGLGLDAWVEAAGAESAERYAPGHWLAVRYGGQVFHALRKNPSEQAVEEGEAIVVLHVAEGSSEHLNELFTKVSVEHHAQFAVPQAKRTEAKCYDANGKLTARLALPDASESTIRALRKILR